MTWLSNTRTLLTRSRLPLRAGACGLLLHPRHSQSRRRQGLLLLQGEGGGGRTVGQEGVQPGGSRLQGRDTETKCAAASSIEKKAELSGGKYNFAVRLFFLYHLYTTFQRDIYKNSVYLTTFIRQLQLLATLPAFCIQNIQYSFSNMMLDYKLSYPTV